MQERSDGLLRGPRKNRVNEMDRLASSPWTLETLVAAHAGLLDHSEEVRCAALLSLLEIAKRSNEPLQLTPVDLVSYYSGDWTVASRMIPAIFKALLDLGTPEGDNAASDMTGPYTRNEDFEWFLEYAASKNHSAFLQRLKSEELSKTKRAMLSRALQKIE